MTAEQINKHIEHFLDIYDENSKEINPIPMDKKVTLWCDDGKGESGFLENVGDGDVSLEFFIAKKWILHSDLIKLVNK